MKQSSIAENLNHQKIELLCKLLEIHIAVMLEIGSESVAEAKRQNFLSKENV